MEQSHGPFVWSIPNDGPVESLCDQFSLSLAASKGSDLFGHSASEMDAFQTKAGAFFHDFDESLCCSGVV